MGIKTNINQDQEARSFSVNNILFDLQLYNIENMITNY